MISKPSENIDTCASCHKEIGNHFKKSLHYTTAGLRNGIHKRFSRQQAEQFDSKVFEQSCRSCHASCGDCHVKTPVAFGINLGLLANHRFLKKKEDKTCASASCHGGRIYAEYTGQTGEARDIHYEKGMTCLDCHKVRELHGDGMEVDSKKSGKGKPACTDCHKLDAAGSGKIHKQHANNTSCQACHVAAEYKQCSSCHIGKGASPSQAFILGRDPQNKDRIVTLRMSPVSRDSFESKGILMDNYDQVANFWTAPVHNIRKRTARTRTCGPCHTENKEGFINEKIFPKDGSRQNRTLLYDYKSFKVYKKQ